MIEIKNAYKHCRLITKKEAKNFFYAFITLPQKKRDAIYATYAFCRHCDDAVDRNTSLDMKLHTLGELREHLESTYAGKPKGYVFTALGHAANTHNIPQGYFQEVINGVEMDLTIDRYQTFEDLKLYCYRVASAVGLICLEIFEYKDPIAIQYAIDLGVAMQLTNIIRDVREDLHQNRIYLPIEDMEKYGFSESDLLNGTNRKAQKCFIKFQVNRARDNFQTGLRILPYLPARSRACPSILAQLYMHILDRVEKNDFNVFDSRIELSNTEKLVVMVTTWMRSFLPRTR